MKRIKAFILFVALFQGLRAFQVFNISTFNYINSVVRYHDRLVLGTDGGVVVYSPSLHKVRATLVTGAPVLLAVPDPLSPDIFFATGIGLYRWSPGFRSPDRLADIQGTPLSLGVDRNYLYVEIGEVIYKYSKIGVYEGKGRGNEDVLWCGKRGSVPEDDPSLAPLMPHFINSLTLGRAEMKVFYRDMDRLWVGTEGLGLYLFSVNTWQVKDSLLIGLSSRDVTAIYRDGSSMWFGGSAGVTYKEGETWIPYSREGMMLSFDPFITDISGDSLFVWFGTDRGVIRYRKKDSSFWLLAGGLHVRSLEKVDGRLWISSDDGLFYMVPPGASLSQVLKGVEVNDVIAGGNEMFFLTEEGVLRGKVENLAGFHRFDDPRGWLDSEVRCGTRHGNELLFVTASGIVLYDEESDTFRYTVPPISTRGSDAIQCTAWNGYFFLTSKGGLEIMKMADFHWRILTRYDGLPDDEVLCVYVDRDTLWIGTENGLSIVTGW